MGELACSSQLLLGLDSAVFLVQWLRLALSEGLNIVDVSLPSPKDGNRSSFWNVMFSSYLEIRTMDNVHKPIAAEYK
jgi:hypothetical protein